MDRKSQVRLTHLHICFEKTLSAPKEVKILTSLGFLLGNLLKRYIFHFYCLTCGYKSFTQNIQWPREHGVNIFK